MQTNARFLCLLLLFLGAAPHLSAQTTAFVYKGQLADGNRPANGSYELQFRIATAATGGMYIGPAVTTVPMAVSNGAFTVTLDFGATAFDGSARWLEIGVRTNSGAGFTLLTPRQEIAATPYAIFSGNAATATTASRVSGPVAASQLTGVLSASQLPSFVLTNGTGNPTSTGNFYVTNSFSAGIVQTSTLAHVTGIPPAEPVVASWAPDPGLGYANWYDYAWYYPPCDMMRPNNTSNNIAAVALQFVANGMLAAGYNWIVIDDGWQDTSRVNGHMAEYLPNFPGGIAGLVSFLHGLGFKVMIYTSYPGPTTCCGYPGTGPADVLADVTYFAQCGFDGMKVDSCGVAFASDAWEMEEVGTRLFTSAIQRCGRPMYLFMNYPNLPPYPPYMGYQDNCFCAWGTEETPSGTNIFVAGDWVMNHMTSFIRPGHYVWMGAIQAGWQNLQDTTNLVAFQTLFQASQHVCTPTAAQLPIFTNKEMVAIAKDPGVIPPARVWDDGRLAAWVKPLGSRTSGTNVIALINRGDTIASVGLSWQSLGINWAMTVRDVWSNATLGGFSLGFTNSALPAHHVRLYKIWPQDVRSAYTGTNTIGTTTLVIRDGLIIDVR